MVIILRFNEWGRAAWHLQCEYLKTPRGSDWRFIAVQSEDSGAFDVAEAKKFITGKMISARILAKWVVIV